MSQVSGTFIGSVIVLILGSKLGNAVEVSKACYGTRGLPCTRHNLTCSSGHIAIQEAFYTDNTACGIALTNCRVNVISIPITGTRYNFSDSELNSLYGNCSTKPTCSFQAGRRAAFVSFSAIRYSCINVTTQTKVTTDSRTTITDLTELSSPQQPTTITLSGTTKNDLTEVSPSKQTTGTHISIGGIFAAGLFAGLCIAAIIAGIVYFVYIRRRCIIKKPDDGPSSVIHPTYAGLTELSRPDTYDVINRPESSESSQAPVYQNMDNDS